MSKAIADLRIYERAMRDMKHAGFDPRDTHVDIARRYEKIWKERQRWPAFKAARDAAKR